MGFTTNYAFILGVLVYDVVQLSDSNVGTFDVGRFLYMHNIECALH